MNFNDLYDTGRVRRFHTVPDYSGGAQQTVAEHAWGVALLVIELGRRMKVGVSSDLLKVALLHDAEEAQVGDLPAPTKWRFPSLAKEMKLAEGVIQEELGIKPALEEFELKLLKWADSLELYAHAQRRARDGGACYRTVVENIHSYMVRELPQWPEAVRLMNEMELGDWV